MVEHKSTSFIPMMIYLKTKSLADCTGISFVDSTPSRVCDKGAFIKIKLLKALLKEVNVP